jgi:hypothetical protein
MKVMRYVTIIFPAMVDRNKIEEGSRWLEFGIWNQEFGNPARWVHLSLELSTRTAASRLGDLGGLACKKVGFIYVFS